MTGNVESKNSRARILQDHIELYDRQTVMPPGAYERCAAALLNYLAPFWERSRRSLRRFIHKLLKPFKKQVPMLQAIAGASLKMLFIAALLYSNESHACVRDQQLMKELGTLMKVEAAAAQHELVVFDPTVKGLPLLMKNFSRNVRYIVLDKDSDGLDRILSELKNAPEAISALHIISHGGPGYVRLGTTTLDMQALSDRREELQAIAARLLGKKEILLYGCSTAAGDVGKSFVSRLHSFTGVEIAASDNMTASPQHGGDWTLEVTTGKIETTPPFAQAALDAYEYNLATRTVTNKNDSGAGSLRQAITDAVSGDAITFSTGGTITLTSGKLIINKNLIINGDLNNDGLPDVTVSGGNSSQVFNIATGKIVTLDGLTITGGVVFGAIGGSAADGTGANGGGGGIAKGGCIVNSGKLYLLHGGVSSCYAGGGNGGDGGGGSGGYASFGGGYSGGNGGVGGKGGNALGGGISSSVSLFTSTGFVFSGNSVLGGYGGYGGGGGGGGGGNVGMVYGHLGSGGSGKVGGAGGSSVGYSVDGGRGGNGGEPDNIGYAGEMISCDLGGLCGGSGGNGGNGGAFGLGQSPDVYNTGSWVQNFVPSVITITSHTPSPSIVGQAVAVSFTVTSAGTPAGTVTVSNGTASCSATVAVGSCNLTINAVGTTPLIATFTEDVTNYGNISPAVLHTTNLIQTSYTVTGSVLLGNGEIPACDSPVLSGSTSVCTVAPTTGWYAAALTDTVNNIPSDVLSQLIVNKYTIASVTGDHAVTVTYQEFFVRRLSGDATNYHLNIQDAFDKTVNNDKILFLNMLFPGAVTFNKPGVSVTLEGGYLSGFGSNMGTTVMNGKVTIKNGNAVMKNIKVQ